eukprot:6198765-Pleurochrysis_carterae.AAC.4
MLRHQALRTWAGSSSPAAVIAGRWCRQRRLQQRPLTRRLARAVSRGRALPGRRARVRGSGCSFTPPRAAPPSQAPWYHAYTASLPCNYTPRIIISIILVAACKYSK